MGYFRYGMVVCYFGLLGFSGEASFKSLGWWRLRTTPGSKMQAGPHLVPLVPAGRFGRFLARTGLGFREGC